MKKRSARQRKLLRNSIFINCAAILLSLYILAPFVWLFISSISTKVELLSIPIHWIPQNPTLDNYRKLMGLLGDSVQGDIPKFASAMRNSLIIALVSTALCLFIATFSAYAFSRMRFRGRNAGLMVIIALRMLPEIALVLPLFMIMQKLHLADTKTFLIIVYSAFILPFAVWMLKSYFDSVPMALEEAALIDGANRPQIIGKIILPIALPGIITTAIFSILMAWDEFLFALIFTSSENAKTLTVTISEFTSRHLVDYGMMTAGGMIASLPPIIFTLLLQKYIINGLADGAVKG